MAAGQGQGQGQGQRGTAARLSTETKQAFKTTEFAVMVLAVIGILIAAAVIGGDSGKGNNVNHDSFPAVRAWLYITIVAAAYMISRGIAKAGSRDPYWADQHDLPGSRDRT